MERQGLAGLAILVTVLIAPVAHAEESIAVIVNPTHGEESISRTTLQDVYLGDLQLWGSKQHIKPCYVKSGQEGSSALFDGVISMTPEAFKKHWLKRVFAGYGSEPAALKSIEDVIQYVAANEGAVGVIPASSAQNAKSCKVLGVE